MKIGVISNTLSERNKGGIPGALKGFLSRPGVRHERIDGVSELASVLAAFAEEDIELIAVNGGDGTISAILTELFGRRIFRHLPALAALPGGMTNMTAGDVGVAVTIRKAAARLTALSNSPQEDARYATRSVMRVTYTPDGAPLCGMFFGAAAIVRAIDFCRRAVHTKRLRSSAAVGMTLAYVLARRCLSGGEDDVFRGDEIAIRYDGGECEEGVQLVVLATTLNSLVLGSRPFWGDEEGGLKFTRIGYPPHRLARFAFRVLYGGRTRKLPDGHYESRNTRALILDMACPFTLDGELFQPCPGTPLTIRTAGIVRFVQ